MNCLWVQKKLSSLLDGELPENICRQIENHLAVCDRCRQEWDYLKLQNQILQRTLPLAVSADWSEKFFRNLSRQKEKSGFSGGNSWLAIYPLSPGGGGAGDDFPWLVNFCSAGLWGFSSGN